MANTVALNRLALAAGLLALVALSWWLPQRLDSDKTAPDGKSRHDPDYIIMNFTAIAMDTSGWRKHELRAEKLTHYPDDDSAVLEKPYLIQYVPDGPPTHTRADRGFTNSEGKEILMRGNVRVTRGSAARAPAGEVTAQEMKVLLP